MTNRERELIAALLGDAKPSPATARWLATPAGSAAATRYRRVLRSLDAWGTATARSRRTEPVKHGAPPADAIYYDRVPTPIGAVFAASGRRGLVRVSFERSEAKFVADLQRRHAGAIVRSPRHLFAIRRALVDYGRGPRGPVDLPVDLGDVSPFQRRVLAAARRIPAGHVLSYGDIARRIGQPRACRAVGQALGRNPVPLVIPCHRVVAGAGRLGGYAGGLARKRRLLTIEGARLAS